MDDNNKHPDVEPLRLSEAAKLLLEECRMVLPGIQALFGFQLMGALQSRFGEVLGNAEQIAHLAATGLVAVAIALVMAPAAYHRQTRPMEVSRAYIRTCSRLLLASMFPLMLGICLDLYLVARIITQQVTVAVAIALAALAAFCWLWLGLPWRRRRADRRREERHP